LRRYDQAIDEIDRWDASEETPWQLAWRAAVYSRSGRAAESRHALAKLGQIGSEADRYKMLVVAYSGTGNKELALQFLEKAYADHSNAVVDLKVDPIYDPIRSDPRFKDLLHRLQLDK